ncbi:hypothetical protein ACXET9_08700 [Brachybacterium sp. DNPG3]
MSPDAASPDAAEILRQATLLDRDQLEQLVQDLVRVLDDGAGSTTAEAVDEKWKAEVLRRHDAFTGGRAEIVDPWESISLARAALRSRSA